MNRGYPYLSNSTDTLNLTVSSKKFIIITKAVDENGNVYAVSFDHKETIGQVAPNGTGSIFIEMPEGSTANGIRFSSDDTMYIADYTEHNILKYHLNGIMSVFAHEPRMNQPNDIAIMDNDTSQKFHVQFL